jgi:L-amino acid N-acyltransferase YncA
VTPRGTIRLTLPCTCGLQGLGGQLYAQGLAAARALGAKVIETVVLESDVEELRFALPHGFVEIERYVLPGDSVAFIDLRLA